MPKAAVKRFRRLPEDEQSRVIEMAWEATALPSTNVNATVLLSHSLF